MVHTVIPTVRAGKLAPAESTGTLLWRLALLVPAAGADVLETGLEGLPFLLGGGVGPACEDPGCMHAALVLGEEILAVEVVDLADGLVVVVAGGSRGVLVVGFMTAVAVADVAAEEAELDVL